MRRDYRKGAIGALMDEYERVASDLKHLVERTPEDEFTRMLDAQTKDEDCRSIRTIMGHVVSAGYAYANYIREVFSIPTSRPASRIISREDAASELDAMLGYTAQTLEGRWEMTDEEIDRILIHSQWGVTYNLEQLLEHAIVHVLRHRRQIERLRREDHRQSSR